MTVVSNPSQNQNSRHPKWMHYVHAKNSIPGKVLWLFTLTVFSSPESMRNISALQEKSRTEDVRFCICDKPNHQSFESGMRDEANGPDSKHQKDGVVQCLSGNNSTLDTLTRQQNSDIDLASEERKRFNGTPSLPSRFLKSDSREKQKSMPEGSNIPGQKSPVDTRIPLGDLYNFYTQLRGERLCSSPVVLMADLRNGKTYSQGQGRIKVSQDKRPPWRH